MPSQRIRNIGLSPTLKISALANQLRAEGADVLDFSAGQPDFPTCDAAKRAGRQAIDDDRTRYTANEGILELRQAIASKLERDNGLRYAPEQILVSPGAKASLYFALMTLLDPGDEAIVPTPYWVSYPPQVQLAGARAVLVRTHEHEDFRLTPRLLRSALTPATRVVILNYPANPTGSCYDREQLRELAAVCLDNDLWIVADEIYEKLMFDDREFVSIAALDDRVQARTVVINGMSKTYAMTGWRIGYAAGPREVLAGMSRLQSHSTSNAASISQWASLGALGEPEQELASRRREFQRRRDALLAALSSVPGIRCARPGGAFYAFPDVSGLFGARDGERPLRSGEDVARLLLERARVAVVPGEAFGAPNHVRLSYAVSIERVEEGVRRIREAVAGLTRP